MVTFFCPSCWSETVEGEIACPNCGASSEVAEDWEYDQKLINALRHPVPESRTMAVTILGRRKVKEAVGPMVELFRTTSDIFFQQAVLEALEEIGEPVPLGLAIAALDSPSFIVRGKAVELLALYGAKQSAELLTRALEDVNEHVREKARAEIERRLLARRGQGL